MNRLTTPYVIGLIAVSLALCIAAVAALEAFTTTEWMQENRHIITTIVGASIVAPWLVAFVQIRHPDRK
jgi:hypothetical protein